MGDVNKALVLLVASYLIVALALGLAIHRTREVAADTNQIVKQQLAQSEQQIQKLNFVLEQQAIPAITYMAEEIDRLGGKPPKVLLTPTGPPFVPPAQAGG